MTYREQAPVPQLRELVEGSWERSGPAGPARVLPDGCMDLIHLDGRIVVAGPDTISYVAAASPQPVRGLRFRPGALPRLLGVPAAELRNIRVDVGDLRTLPRFDSLETLAMALIADRPRAETAPWSTAALRHVTRRFADGATVDDVAHDLGCSARTLHRHCLRVYGYGPAMLRRVLRFRRAVGLLGGGAALSTVAAASGYADQPHLHREVRALAGVGVRQLLDAVSSAANRSTDVPSGSSTVA
ncbi:helix-turn-helix domain-containing protein [Mycolicibacterium goodii]|uniref:AraC family transcriptional regulator n=1 Tax=Mycolicibacterium goodii TaxID=134601 RepID=A0A0K0X4P1_MYCGD|nr:AraC family transcriptional regulator [Mycolicibacterium goodii]